jgi:hypothetical protein
MERSFLLFHFLVIIVHHFTRRNCVAHVGTIVYINSSAERCSSASKIAPVVADTPQRSEE